MKIENEARKPGCVLKAATAQLPLSLCVTNPEQTFPSTTFQQPSGPGLAYITRSKSFPGSGNSYRVEFLIGLYCEWFTEGISVATDKADEVARNGVLQRITSARGFL
jgi:hypothetical protein